MMLIMIRGIYLGIWNKCDCLYFEKRVITVVPMALF